MARTGMSSPPHHVPIAAGWALWQWMWVRAAGFPAHRVLRLAAPQSAKAADTLAEKQAQREAATAQAIAALETLLETKQGKARKPIAKAIKHLRAGRIASACASTDPPLAEAATTLAVLARASEACAGAAADLARTLENEAATLSATLCEIAADPRFREAVLWQNRRAVRSSLDRVVSRQRAARSKDRQHEHMIASYLQRYCVKNDTIGFFGPVCWGDIVDASPGMRAEPGKNLLARRTVYFEYWGIDRLAEKLGEDPALKPHLRPRRKPAIWVEGQTLHYPVERTARIPAEHAHLLRACDGARSAAQIAAAVCADATLELDEADEVYELLDELSDRGLITWGIEIPPVIAHPDAYLRELLENAGEAGELGLKRLHALVSCRDAIAAAAGNPAALDAALAKLESTFTDLTGQEATRADGKMYAGRSLVYEDCRRDLHLAIGRPVLDRLGPPLSLVLQSARWFTHRIATLYRQVFEAAYDALVEKAGSPVIDYLRYWSHVEHHFPVPPDRVPLVEQATAELNERWAKLLALAAHEPFQKRSSAAIAPGVAAAFSAPHPGWPTARYQSPDLLVAAPDIEAINRGECVFVLGELHAATNTSAILLAQNQHADPPALLCARQLDLPDPAVVPVIGKEAANRAAYVLLADHNIEVELGSGRSSKPRDRVLAVGSLVVERVDGRLVVRERSGSRRLDIVAFFADYITNRSASAFSLLPNSPYTPRVAIDDLVVCRQTWRFSPGDLAFATIARGAEQFVAARRWASAHRLPRHIFIKIPEETKPVYADLDSPIYVEILAKLARRASVISVSEMLPDLDQMWLTDHEGNAYACELRLVAVDPEPWRPPSPSKPAPQVVTNDA